ncbi:conserved repeat domain-containing protein/Por secretion system C-terminal sorting domain-containing protein [Chitinophaga filiformis]|uniref:Conserved repeat domain-containing protein/Por secretion system C-terminal sorting domain-containing protein n=2 Tax=Chitinophaga filiformis TaxID=104663 RepID=A0A1G7MN77_CHIFI|nr:conserved repeat domain-containing protein/Por secretion system C-terminal sorting domain-containing protein [Chitinophaga filiformis]
MRQHLNEKYLSLRNPICVTQQNCSYGALIQIFLLFLLLMPVSMMAQSTKTFTVNMTGDESDPNANDIGDDGKCDVDPITMGDQCTFRAAIQNQNGNRNLGQNRITFAIPNAPGTGSIVIKIGSTGLGALPPILGSVAIDAVNNDGRRIELDGSMAGGGAIGLRLLGGGCEISFFVINSFSSHGMFISGTPPPGEGGHRIQNNYIGTDFTGTVAKGNGGDGIFIDNTPGSIIGGTGIARNIISGNEGRGINIQGLDSSQFGTNGASNNLAIGNLIGLDISGENALPNKGDAVVLNNAPNNTIGGAAPNEGNKMAGTTSTNGVTVTGSFTEGIKILGNFIGENKTGAKFKVGIAASAKPITIEGNVITDIVGVGIDLFVKGDGSYNIRKNSINGNMTIGSKLRFGEGRNVQMMYQNNLHTGNGMALDVVESVSGKIDWIFAGDTLKLGQAGANFIFHAAGNKDFSNGVYQGNAGVAFNYVADLAPGVQMALRAKADAYTGNAGGARTGKVVLKAGTEFSYALLGSSAVNNGKDGDRLDLFADANVIATLTAMENRFAFNGGGGLRWISDGKNLVTVRAFIEKDIFEKNVLGGLEVTSFLTEKSILDNTVIDNGGPGILINGTTIAHLEGNTISGNGIGILVNDAATASINNNTITANGKGIAFGGTGTGSPLIANTIFKNTGLGIDLGNDGPTANDAGDADAGPNNLQNFPVLTAVSSNGGNTSIQGTLNSTPNTTFRLDFFSNDACNPTGFGEGQAFLDSFKVTTDASGNAAFNAILTGITLPAGAVVTSTATDRNHNTSEFSACLQNGNVETADLELTKKADKAQYTVGDPVIYTLLLTNKGTANAPDVVVTDLLPAGIMFKQATATVGTYDNTTGKWQVALLNSGQQATLTITGTANVAGTITNTAEVTASKLPDPDSSPGNGISTEDDQSSVSVQVIQQQPDVAQQYRALMQQITALVNAGRLTPREGRILNGIVAISLALENRGQIQPAIFVLRVFIVLVRNATQRTRLTNVDRNALINAAQKIINELRAMPLRQSSATSDSGIEEWKDLESRARKELMGEAFIRTYPNPFNSYTVITFDVANESRVQLNVYDVNGRMIATLMDKVMQPGVQTITWQTPDLPAGVYLLQLRANDAVTTYKVLHVRE